MWGGLVFHAVNGKVVDGNANGDDTHGDTQLNGSLNNGKHHQEEADDEEDDGESQPYL